MNKRIPQVQNNDIVAGLDVGDVRIGVSLTRVEVGLPRPVTTMTNDAGFWQQLTDFIQENGVTVLVVGLPRGMDGQETAQTAKTRDFAKKLAENTNLPVYLQDEAATSLTAEAELKARGRYNKEMVDALAATLILEDFLKEQRSMSR